MNAERLLVFHRIGDLPGAIPRLRRFILDLAVRGKLVPQHAKDETAAELLKRIAAEKARLVKAGRSRHDHPEPISGEQEPFAVPSSWRWTRLGAIAELVRGISFPASDKATIPGLGLLPCFRSGNVQSEIIWGNFIFVPRVVLKGVHQFVREGDILMSIANSYALVGKARS